MQMHTTQQHKLPIGFVTLLLIIAGFPLVLTGILPVQIVGGGLLLLALFTPSLGKSFLEESGRSGNNRPTIDQSLAAKQPRASGEASRQRDREDLARIAQRLDQLTASLNRATQQAPTVENLQQAFESALRGDRESAQSTHEEGHSSRQAR